MHPVLFELFGYPVHLYAVMIAMGFVVGIWLSARYGERVGLDRDMILDLCWWLIVSGLVGSRIAFIIVEWDQYYLPCVDFEAYNLAYPARPITEPDCTRLLRFWNGGLVYYGGVIGAMLTMVWFLRREKISIWPVADALIPQLALAPFFGRMGCLAAGCCWGAPTNSSWGVHFPRHSMPWAAHVKEGLIPATAMESANIHAVQLYDGLGALALFGLLVWLRQRKRYHGQVFIWWMFIYPLWRGSIEFIRGDAERGFIFEVSLPWLNKALSLPEGTVNLLSTSQMISLGFMAVAVGILVKKRGQKPLGSDPDPDVNADPDAAG